MTLRTGDKYRPLLAPEISPLKGSENRACSDQSALQKLLSIRDLMDFLGLSRATLERKRLDGTGPPYVRIGMKIYYPERLLAEWIERNVVRSTAEWNAKRQAEGP